MKRFDEAKQRKQEQYYQGWLQRKIKQQEPYSCG